MNVSAVKPSEKRRCRRGIRLSFAASRRCHRLLRLYQPRHRQTEDPFLAPLYRAGGAVRRAPAPADRKFHRLFAGQRRVFRVSCVRYLLRRIRHKLQGSAPRGGARRAPLLCGDGADGGADGCGRVCRVPAAAFRKDRLGGEYAHRVRALLYGRGLRL